MGSQYGLLVLLKIAILGMSYDTHDIFYILVNFAFNLPNNVTSYMHYSGKKNNNNKATKNLLPGNSNPDPPIS